METSIASAAVEGTLTLDRGAKLALADRGRPSSIEVLVLRKATITGHSPLTVTGTLTWGNGGRIEGDAPLLLARGSSTTFDPGDGGNGPVGTPGDGSVRAPPPLTPAGAARPPDQKGR